MIANATKSFLRAWKFALQWENAKVEHDPDDAGGVTKYGVDQRSYPHVNIPALTADQAGQIYHDDAWLKCRCDDLPDDLAIVVFDCAMLSGKGTSIQMLQETLGVTVDGFIGPKTLAAARDYTTSEAAAAVGHFLRLREAFLRNAATVRKNKKYLAGWINRNNDLRKLLLADGSAATKKGGGAASGSVGLAAPLCLSAVTFLASSVAYGFRFAASVPPPEFSGWLACASFAATTVLTALHIRGAMKPDPPLEKRFASVERVDGLEGELAELKVGLETKHTENTRRLGEMNEKLDRNWKEVIEKTGKTREEVRHDMRNELTPITTTLTARSEDADKQFRTLAGEIGALKQATLTSAARDLEFRQLLDTILQRLPRGGAPGA